MTQGPNEWMGWDRTQSSWSDAGGLTHRACGLRREDAAIYGDCVLRLARVFDPQRKALDDRGHVWQRILHLQRRVGRPDVIRANGHVLAAVVSVEYGNRARTLDRRGVLHDREQLRLTVIGKGVGNRDGDHVVHVIAAAATNVSVDDQLLWHRDRGDE